jgi:hypothetical protein
MNTLEDEIGAVGVVDSRDGVFVRGHVPHDRRLERGVSARSVPAEHPPAVQGEHVSVVAARDQFHDPQPTMLIDRDLRVAEGWSSTQPARAAGITQPALARFDTGRTIPSLPVPLRLARALDADLTVTVTPHTDIA